MNGRGGKKVDQGQNKVGMGGSVGTVPLSLAVALRWQAKWAVRPPVRSAGVVVKRAKTPFTAQES